MPHYDDSDMKIFGAEHPADRAEDVVAFASALDQQRKNGNLRRAKFLGEKLAFTTPESASELFPDFATWEQNFTASDLYQARALMIFSAQVGLHGQLPPLLSSQAVNALYNALEESSAGFYHNIIEGTSFSFYYLSLRLREETPRKIGENYAMLCGAEENESYIEVGMRIFQWMQSYIADLIQEVKFR